MNSDEPSFSRLRQSEIYINGISGQKPVVPISYIELKEAAEKKLSKEAFSYLAGGAGQETTISKNREAFKHWSIQPRMLRDVSALDTSIELLGHRYPVPFLLAPIGVLGLFHKEADKEVAQASAAEGVPMIFSSQASVSMEKCAAVMDDAPRWFQLYWSTSNKLVKSFVKRAENCGCQAIVLTLDTTMLGWRTRDLDLAYLPFLLAKGIAQYTSDPVFKELMEEHRDEDPDREKSITFSAICSLFKMSRNYPGSTFRNLVSGEPMRAVRTFIKTYSRPSLTWENLSFLRGITDLPILLKGILHPDDARKAVEYGMNGVIVSNHGGRQVDGAIPALGALPSITTAVDGEIPVFFDSGIRTGADIFKALALGANAVLLGRPYAYGLSLAGREGVREVIQNLRADFELTMGLSGIKSIDKITANPLESMKI
ncbi:lactate 2-monooxygenase [Aliifodinibius sp. S!AR15-10]|uniref:lactate 2-monooxygenase n=1 Tax=Aliifodinibius sp. S!AR15-10 TaxID=2950437 RepID=UPI0028607B4D|nr:lactate 2-monooxygenase [Aliifodinibius sp. S!AR15-10]MDR8394267.1 lactate 2-monooxygenase [Aliifodinibius sp. S!AR15-10]